MVSPRYSFFRLFGQGCLIAGCLAGSVLADDPVVVLSGLTQDFTGSGIIPGFTTNPPGLPVTLVYRDLSPAAPAGEVETVFNNTPAVLPLSYASLSFSANGVSALGNYVRLGGGSRKLESCEVILVTWAKAAQYPAWEAINAAGYSHTVTLTLFAVTPANQFTFLTTLSRSILVPWRPETLPGGQPYPFNGYAFRAQFDFPDGIILPEQVMVMVDYDTGSTGLTPIGQPGPYDVLNVALDGSAASIGSDVNADEVLRVVGDTYYYPTANWSGINGPMIRLRARSTVTKTPPYAPGAYQVTAMAGTTGTDGTVQETLTISPPSFAKWQIREFTEIQRTGGAAAPSADPDEDGLTNLTEYAMGTSPHGFDGSGPLELDPAGLTMTLDRPRWLTGVNYHAEESSDLDQWVPVPLAVLSSNATRERVRAVASPGARAAPRTFLRIRFDQ